MPRNGHMSRSARRANKIAPRSNQATMLREAAELHAMGMDVEADYMEERASTINSGAMVTQSTRSQKRSMAKGRKNGCQEVLAKMNESVPHSPIHVWSRLRAKLQMRLNNSDSGSDASSV